MKTLIREFLYYSRTEQRGIIVLGTLVLLVIAFRIYLRVSANNEIIIPPEEFQAIRQWVAQQSKQDSILQETRSFKRPEKKKLTVTESFHPNILEQKDWMALGFSEKESLSILKFRSKSGGFRYKEDLQKLFCMTEERYAVLAPFVLLPAKPEYSDKKSSFPSSKQHRPPGILEINQADSLQLITVRGIGPGWARRILKRRSQLGGFYSLDQLLEIKGLSDSLLTILRPFLKIDTTRIQKLDINHIPLEEIQKHPYCWYGVGKSIVNYRLQHGPYKTVDELKKIYTLRPETFEKLVHYVTIE